MSAIVELLSLCLRSALSALTGFPPSLIGIAPVGEEMRCARY